MACQQQNTLYCRFNKTDYADIVQTYFTAMVQLNIFTIFLCELFGLSSWKSVAFTPQNIFSSHVNWLVSEVLHQEGIWFQHVNSIFLFKDFSAFQWNSSFPEFLYCIIFESCFFVFALHMSCFKPSGQLCLSNWSYLFILRCFLLCELVLLLYLLIAHLFHTDCP